MKLVQFYSPTGCVISINKDHVVGVVDKSDSFMLRLLGLNYVRILTEHNGISVEEDYATVISRLHEQAFH